MRLYHRTRLQTHERKKGDTGRSRAERGPCTSSDVVSAHYRVDELGYTRRRSVLHFEQIEALVSYPADAAWLTIIDGLGEREDPPASVANAWYEVLNPRWLRGGWTIITSNHTPDELVRNGTIGDATYSRLQQMTGGYIVVFVGSDARLRSAEEIAYGTD